jgi:HKD family nuclease
MEIIFEDLQNIVHQKLKAASSIIIAVAYFRPDIETLKTLKNIPKIKIIVSKEFDKSDPYKLEEIILGQENHTAKCIPVFPNRLHAKMIYGKRTDGSSFAFVGSANLTSDGLSQNREATILFDSDTKNDEGTLRDISEWLKALYKTASDINYVEAKKIFDSSPHHYIGRESDTGKSTKYWTIKTRDGQDPDADDFWSKFRSEEVIALGWGGGLKTDPREISLNELRTIYQKEGHPPTKAGRIANEIKQFSGQNNGIKTHDIVWIIGSFTPNQKHPVYIYGVAKVEGELVPDFDSKWWKHKRKATIIPIERTIEIAKARECFEMDAMTETLYLLNKASFEKVSTQIHKQHGITINL